MTDDPVETLLTRHGQAWRADQPAAPPLATMTGAASPARAPWLLPALVAAALLVPVVGTVTLLRQHGSHQASKPAATRPPAHSPVPVLVPWADLPATGPVSADRLAARGSTDEVPPSPPSAVQPCEAGDFAAEPAVAIQLPGAAPRDTGGYLLTVRRVGGQPCALGAPTPTLEVFDAAGRRLGIGRSASLIGFPGYQLLYPGDVLQVPARLCGTDIASLALLLAAPPDGPGRMDLPAGPRVSIPFTGVSTCTSGTSVLSHQQVLPGGSLASLVRSYAVPSRVRAGRPLDYTVTLTNPTATAVRLDPCPSYRQSLIDVLKLPDRHGATSTGRLNCAAAPASVPAHGSIGFRFRLDTAAVPAGDRRLVWDWLGSTTTGIGGYPEFPTVTVYQ